MKQPNNDVPKRSLSDAVDDTIKKRKAEFDLRISRMVMQVVGETSAKQKSRYELGVAKHGVQQATILGQPNEYSVTNLTTRQ